MTSFHSLGFEAEPAIDRKRADQTGRIDLGTARRVHIAAGRLLQDAGDY